MSSLVPDRFRDLYYMAPLQNAVSIAAHGVYSYNKVRELPALLGHTTSIADPFVNSRRHQRVISGRSLHDYVPLYWSTHTPMQYVVTLKARRLPQSDLIFFLFDAERLLQMPGVMTTDGNAAAAGTRICQGLEAIPYIDWSIVDEPKCYSSDYKRRKCAEVLVPDHVPNSAIHEICVYSQSAGDNLRAQISQNCAVAEPVSICVRTQLYYVDIFDS